MVQVKSEFREVTKQQVEDFQEVLKRLKATFMESGPSSPGMDLDHGLDLVREYKQKLVEINHQKEALVNAQKLFGIDVTRYPELAVRARGQPLLCNAGCAVT